MSTAYGAGHTTMSDIGGDTSKMESMGTLRCEYSLPRTAACAVVAEKIKTYCTQILPQERTYKDKNKIDLEVNV